MHILFQVCYNGVCELWSNNCIYNYSRNLIGCYDIQIHTILAVFWAQVNMCSVTLGELCQNSLYTHVTQKVQVHVTSSGKQQIVPQQTSLTCYLLYY